MPVGERHFDGVVQLQIQFSNSRRSKKANAPPPLLFARRGVRLHCSPPSRGKLSLRAKPEGVKRRQALVRIAAPVARLAVGPVPEASGTPAHDAGRRAFRRFTAAFCVLGAVLPGSDGGLFARPIPRLSPRSSFPRPAIEGSPT